MQEALIEELNKLADMCFSVSLCRYRGERVWHCSAAHNGHFLLGVSKDGREAVSLCREAVLKFLAEQSES